MTNDSSAATEPRISIGALSVADTLLDAGFVLMLAWHYLVLFSSVFGDLENGNVFDYFFARQLVLYLSLAVAFGGVWVFGRVRDNRGGKSSASPALVYAAGLYASAASALYALAAGAQLVIPLQLALMALLGASEGLLMCLWLRCFVERRGERFSNSFAIDMIAGGLLALLICLFQWPIGPVAAVVVPLLSSLVLAREKRLARNAAKDGDHDAESSPASSSGACAMAFAGNVAGGGASLLCDANCECVHSVEDSHRQLVERRNRQMTLFVAIYAIVFGCMQGAFATANVSLLLANNTIVLLGIVIAGIVIACVPRKFGTLQSIDAIHRVSLILFVFGAVIASCFRGDNEFFAVSQIAMLAGFNLFDFGVLMYEILNRRAEEVKGQSIINHTRPVVYLGMTAGMLVSHALTSAVAFEDLGMTLTLVCGVSITVLVTTILVPFYSSYSEEAPSCIGCSHLTLPALYLQPSDITPSVSDAPEGWESPWRRACNEIARQYQLSPRETEIFFLVAKGRNADYIQQELVISTHTAKTHIANIYRKLDVHSSQELLDLVEETRGKSEQPLEQA